MNQQESHREGPRGQTEPLPAPTFKPVALPALAAAIRASKLQPKRSKEIGLPAILRKEAFLG
jgi:hypothetical protein